MEISSIAKGKNLQPQAIQEPASEIARPVKGEENERYSLKSKVDSSEISSSHSSAFDDKRLAVAKSALLYEASVDASDAHIADIKAQVQSGTYQISNTALANAILG